MVPYLFFGFQNVQPWSKLEEPTYIHISYIQEDVSCQNEK